MFIRLGCEDGIMAAVAIYGEVLQVWWDSKVNHDRALIEIALSLIVQENANLQLGLRGTLYADK